MVVVMAMMCTKKIKQSSLIISLSYLISNPHVTLLLGCGFGRDGDGCRCK